MELNEIVKGAFEKAFPGVDFTGVRVLPATDPRFGDYQCNDALKFAKKLGCNPRDAAAKVAEALLGGGAESVFEKAEVAGPGFLKRCGGRPRETLDFIGLDLENGLWRRSFLLMAIS